MLEACARRKRRHEVSVDRRNAGGIRRRLRILRIVDAPDAVAELEQFALDALVAPGFVLAGHPFDQRDDHWVDGWAPGAARVGPLLGDQAAMPAQDRGRGDHAMPAQPRGQVSDECGEQGSVGPVEAGLGVGSAEYGDLVAEDEELDVLG
jgi:hypothetical protein